jgi:hypothetical protein
VGGWTDEDGEPEVMWEVKKNTYLGGPCPVAGHPIAMEAVLLAGVLIGFSGGKGPLPFKERISEEGLNDF